MSYPEAPLLTPDAIDALLWPLLHAHAPLRPVPLCPPLKAFSAEDELPLWQAIEAALERSVEAPFYAVAWPGAQALARAVQDDLRQISGRHVLDLGCGSGLAAIAAAASGAASVAAVDLDPLALSACRALAIAHGLRVSTTTAGLPVGLTRAQTAHALLESGLLDGIDLLLVGDLVYNEALGLALRHTLSALQEHFPRMQVLIADSGRPYFSETVARAIPLSVIARHNVAVPAGVEGRESRHVRVYSMTP